MKKIEQRSECRDFFEMTRADFFTDQSSTPNEWLREIRHELELSLRQLGDLVGVNLVQVWKWEKGRVDPPKSALLCTLFLKIIRTIADDELKLATYPPDQREAIMKLTQGDSASPDDLPLIHRAQSLVNDALALMPKR